MPKASNRTDLSRMNRAADNVKLGDLVAELIAAQNASNAAFRALVTKLNADAGVTDTNYSSASLVDVKSLEDR